MRLQNTKVFLFFLILAATFMVLLGSVIAQEPSNTKPAPSAEEKAASAEEKAASAPDVAKLAPRATALAERLTDLERGISELPDLAAIEKEINGIAENEKNLSSRLEALRSSSSYEIAQFTTLRSGILLESGTLGKVIQPITAALKEMEVSRQEWSDEKEQWKKWRASPPKDVPASAVKPSFVKAEETINKALGLISQHLKPMLAVQQKAGALQAKLYSLASGVDSLISVVRIDILRKSTPPMYSSRYYAKFHKGLWDEMRKGLASFSWPEKQFFERSKGLIFLQVLLALAIIVAMYRYRTALGEEERWRFFVKRPISVGVFFASAAVTPYYQSMPPIWTLGMFAAVSIAAARLVGGLITGFWRIRLFHGLAVLVIVTQLLEVFAVPLPVFRLYVFLMALTGLFFCFWRSVEGSRLGASPLHIWSLRLCGLVFVAVCTTEVVGYSDWSLELFQASLSTIYFIVLFWMLMFMARGGLQLAVQSPFLQKIPFVRSNADLIVRRSAFLINFSIFFFLIGYILQAWNLYDNPFAAVEALLSYSLTIGSWQISVGLVITAVAVLYGSLLVSWTVQALLMEGFFSTRELEPGVRISMARLVHLALVLVGFVLAMIMLGVNMRNVTIIGGALGVGIGFGLQGVVNNFVSGLILLFERPIKVGDYVQLGEQWAEIKNIGLRATIIQMFDRSEVVVPNSDLISNQVTNWTLSDRFVRITILVGVAYGSDVPLVMETLMACAMANSKVMRMPEPQILFMRFGNSSLDFELRVWVSNVDDRLEVTSGLHREIDARFRQAKIEIAFPQRDLHIRSVEESPGSTETPPSDHHLRVVPRKEYDEEDE